MTQPSSPPKVLKAKLLAMMVLRVVFALAFLTITSWFQIREQPFAIRPIFYPLYGTVAALGLLTIVYAILLQKIKNLVLFTYVQVTIDIALITFIVFVTGGVESYLSTLYLQYQHEPMTYPQQIP